MFWRVNVTYGFHYIDRLRASLTGVLVYDGLLSG